MSYVLYFYVFLVVFNLATGYSSSRRGYDSKIKYPDDDYRPIGVDIPPHYQQYNHPVVVHDDSEYSTYSDKYSSEMSQEENEIPLDYIKHLTSFNVSDLLLNFVENEEQSMDKPTFAYATKEIIPMFADRFGGIDEKEEIDANERSAFVVAKKAGCIPEMKAVEIVRNYGDIFYIPQCTRVERCGGCCDHKLLSCQPIETEIITMQVIKTQYNPNTRKLKKVGKELIQVEKHNKCKCDCKTKKSDCNIYQEYHANECRCVCKNIDEEQKCYKNNETKLWDPDVCACTCKDRLNCEEGFKFDQNDCRCVPVTTRRYTINYDSDEE
ncbi:unnamed protein product [Brassicogethes aeneus]|uniref:Platelet-derived growth factor (PDGF) family profile domain-containing protein n=1 Tax=Brassicogethes aeneus TaxID=1431903 RepID=A0A9P0BC90_BRAAE|nr:unnamed protein product [Brassicogethes aeneus]